MASPARKHMFIKRPPLFSEAASVSKSTGSAFNLFHRCFRRIATDRIDAIQAGSLRLVSFSDGNDLAVFCFQTETELAGFVRLNLKLGVGDGFIAFHGLVFQLSFDRISANGFDAIHTCMRLRWHRFRWLR